MNTAEKFAELDDEYKGYCYGALMACKCRDDYDPKVWDEIVDFYWKEYTTPPLGWFAWWEY